MLAKNEQEQISECLENVYGWADEIVLLDDESSDKTCAIARNYTSSIFTRRMELEGKQRNFGAAQAKHDWILRLDCDERLTDEPKEEISHAIRDTESKITAYWAPQINHINNTPLNYGGWSNPHLLLYNKKFLKWSEADYDVVHPGLQFLPGCQCSTLKAKNLHYSFRNLNHFIDKINRYSTLEASKWYLDGRKMSFSKAMWRSFDRIFRRFVLKKGYKDG